MAFTRSQAAGLGEGVSPPMRRPQAEIRKQGPSKRKLFEHCAEPRQWVAEGAGVAEQAVAEPAVSMDLSQSAAPSAPPTPRTVDRERLPSDSPSILPLHPDLEPAMELAMQGWRTNLVALQPKVAVGDGALLGAIALMRAFASARPDLSDTLHNSVPHLFTYTCAALWVSAKTGGVRTAIPNRTLMSQACQIHPQALSDFEMDLCISLNWEVTKVLRCHNLLQ